MPGSTLRDSRRIVSFSLREKAGMRAARFIPRAPVRGPIRVYHPHPLPSHALLENVVDSSTIALS
jgi:hypothetical protein